MNATELVNYGIQNERSHIRVHVCPVVKTVYVYPTAQGLEAITSGKFRKVPGFQPDVTGATSEGYLVPPFEIRKCVGIEVNDGVWNRLGFSDSDTLTEKGGKATRLVLGMLEQGLFPFPVVAEEVTDADLQIQGADILVGAAIIAREGTLIQVKCDYRGGERDKGGTGNLFLQVAECNPRGRH